MLCLQSLKTLGKRSLDTINTWRAQAPCIPRTRTYIHQDHENVALRLFQKYFFVKLRWPEYTFWGDPDVAAGISAHHWCTPCSWRIPPTTTWWILSCRPLYVAVGVSKKTGNQISEPIQTKNLKFGSVLRLWKF